MFLIEVLDPESFAPVKEGTVGSLVVTPLWTNNITPFLRWNSGDLVTLAARRRRVRSVLGLSTGQTRAPHLRLFQDPGHQHQSRRLRGLHLPRRCDQRLQGRSGYRAGPRRHPRVDRSETRRRAVAAADALKAAVRDKFGLTPQIAVVETGTLAREFEASVKMPRFPIGGSSGSSSTRCHRRKAPATVMINPRPAARLSGRGEQGAKATRELRAARLRAASLAPTCYDCVL